MKLRLLPFLLLFLAPAALQAQDIVTGHVTLPSGAAPANVKICFTLGNFSPNTPKVINTGTLVAVKNFCISPAADGSYSTPLMGNDVITPISTNWRVDFLVNGLQQSSATYYVNHTPFNLDTEVPLSVTTPAGPNQMVTQAFRFTQLTPATTWTITHNFNDSDTIVSSADANGQLIFPDTTNCRTNPNVCTLTFVSATSGFAIAMHAGAINIATNQPNAVVQNPLGAQTIAQPLSLSSSLSAPNVNSLLSIDGLLYATCQDAINAAGSVNKTVILIPSTYTGPDCPTVTNVDGQQESLTSPNITFWNFRDTGTGHIGADWNGSSQDTLNHVQTRLSIYNYSAALTTNFTTSAILGTNQITGPYPSGSVAAITGEVDTTGALSNMNNGILQAVNCEWHVRSTGQTIPFVAGCEGGGGFDRSSSTTNVSQAYSISGDTITNNASASTVLDVYSVRAASQTIGTRSNGGMWLNGTSAHVRFDEGSGIDISNGSTPIRYARFGVANAFSPGGMSLYVLGVNGLGAPINFIDPAGTHKNWRQTFQEINSECIDWIQSTAAGNTTFTTPEMTLCGTGLKIGGGSPLATSNQTGTGNIVLATSPALTTPTVGGGSTINAIYRGSALSLNSAFTSITAGTCQEQTLTLTGAATTGVASVQPTATPGANFSWSAWVSSTNTISVRLCAGSTATPTSVTWNASVLQ